MTFIGNMQAWCPRFRISALQIGVALLCKYEGLVNYRHYKIKILLECQEFARSLVTDKPLLIDRLLHSLVGKDPDQLA